MKDNNTEIFIPIAYSAYKESKIATLKTQMRAVQTVDRLHRLREIRKIKNDSRKLLNKTLKELKQEYNHILKLLPTENETNTKEARSIQHRQMTDFHIKNTTENRIKARTLRKSRLDHELTKIQEKINNLHI